MHGSVSFIGIDALAVERNFPGMNFAGRRGGAIRGLPLGKGDVDVKEKMHSSFEMMAGKVSSGGTRFTICFDIAKIASLVVEFDTVNEVLLDTTVEALFTELFPRKMLAPALPLSSGWTRSATMA